MHVVGVRLARWCCTAEVSFVVFGTAITQGSMRHVGKGRMLHGNDEGLKAWRDAVAKTAMASGVRCREGACAVILEVSVPRPASHFRKGTGALKPGQPFRPRKDVDKLLRAVLDALAGVAYINDAQVLAYAGSGEYVQQAPQARITVQRLQKAEDPDAVAEVSRETLEV